jgi:hypothetical protein
MGRVYMNVSLFFFHVKVQYLAGASAAPEKLGVLERGGGKEI